jgi:hypothetical protein
MSRIAIIGAGWYGCHIAAMLIADGQEVAVFERNYDIFTEASGNNQFRLHLGLHYARSARTRHQTRDGYHRFIERYPRFTREVPHNLYVVPLRESLIDFDTYVSIMLSSGIRVRPEPMAITHTGRLLPEMLDGVVSCDERLLLPSVSTAYFRSKLRHNLRLGTQVSKIERRSSSLLVGGETFDHVVDTTWGGLSDSRPGYFFEGTVLFYFRLRDQRAEFPAITLVDGPLWSIYPTEVPGRFTLSHVVHTPLFRGPNKSSIHKQMQTLTDQDLMPNRKAMVSHVERFLPAFSEIFEYEGPQLAIKMKPIDAADERACVVMTEDKFTTVVSGKIDNIFYASDHLLGILQDH